MVFFPETNETDSADSDDADSDDADRTLIDRLAAIGETLTSIIAPWTDLLTAIVQAATVWKLIQKS